MPELPDLEVFGQNLNKKLKGKKLISVNVLKPKNINVSKGILKKKLEGQKISRIYREGKELRFAFQNKNIIGLHLMLRGKLFWFDENNENRHTLLELLFGKGANLAITDYQYSAKITLNPSASPAPDALSKRLSEKFLQQKLQSKAKIKSLLLDQHIIRGIGNAYADEILWTARISPFSIANKIPKPRIRKLLVAIKSVLKKAIQSVKKAEPGIIGGELRSFLNIHNAGRKLSPGGAVIKNKSIGGRKTYYTDEQVIYS
jgi:formamidopyrimidine-DNA glycosylase